MIDIESIKRLFDVGVRDIFRTPYLPKIMCRKGKVRLTLEQEYEWKYRFNPEWKELYE